MYIRYRRFRSMMDRQMLVMWRLLVPTSFVLIICLIIIICLHKFSLNIVFSLFCLIPFDGGFCTMYGLHFSKDLFHLFNHFIQVYIGETKRTLNIHIKEHRWANWMGEKDRLKITNHVWDEGDDWPKWNKTNILDQKENHTQIQTMETVYIMSKTNNLLASPWKAFGGPSCI